MTCNSHELNSTKIQGLSPGNYSSKLSVNNRRCLLATSHEVLKMRSKATIGHTLTCQYSLFSTVNSGKSVIGVDFSQKNASGMNGILPVYPETFNKNLQNNKKEELNIPLLSRCIIGKFHHALISVSE